MKIIKILLIFVLFVSVLISCTLLNIAPTPFPLLNSEAYKIIPSVNPPTLFPSPAVTPIPLGPLTYPHNVNPLNGMVVNDSANLKLPPVLVSIPNFPITARPQAGLSFSPIVFEVFIGDGMTRNLAIFYGDYPSQAITGNPNQSTLVSDAVIGPIRSGRISFEKFRRLYNGHLIMASAYKAVAEQLNQYSNIFSSDYSDVNSALLQVSQMKTIVEASGKNVEIESVSGMLFDSIVPEGGETAHSLWLFYSNLNQIFWRYNQQDGSFHRFQDNSDGATFIEATDRLNGKPLKFSNVIIMFVKHEVLSKYNIDLDLLYKKKESAILFRDGRMYPIYWTTASEKYEQTTGRLRPIRFIDKDGKPVALKPGQTWIHIIPPGLELWETINSEKYNQLMAGKVKGSGYWALRFKDPTLR